MQLTLRGILLLVLAAPLMAGGTWLPALGWIAGLYILLCLFFIYGDWRLAEGIAIFDVERIHDTKLSLGAYNVIKLAIQCNCNRRVAFTVRDEPPTEFEITERILSGEVQPRQTWTGVYRVKPHRRGNYQFGNINMRWYGPFGLVIRQGRVEAAGQVKVYPNLLDIRQYDLLLQRNRLQDMGLRNSQFFGEGTEFDRLREYIPDDPYRRINWKATARRNRPITAEYQTERSQNLMLMLDIGRMSQSPVDDISKLDYMVNTAALLSYVAIKKGDKVGMMTFANEVDAYLSPQLGKGQFYKILEVLYPVRSQNVEPNYNFAASYLGLKLRKRSLIVLFTDLSGDYGVQALIRSVSALSQRSLPLVVTISDPDIHAAAEQRPRDSFTTYQRDAAVDFLHKRELTLNTLNLMGILTLDTPADKLSVAMINQYLKLKTRAML